MDSVTRTRAKIMAGLVLLVGAANFLTGLGSSSLYTDEGFSWRAAAAPTLGEVTDRVSEGEIAPPLYYLGLHEVVGRVSDSEVVMRLPSAIAAICLVAAILWLGTLVAGIRSGTIAAGLAALSPLLLEYAQQVRAYIFVMLAVTLAAGALIEAQRRQAGSRARRRWLLMLVIASVVGFWTHYTAALVIGPLLIVAALQLSRRETMAVGASIGAGWLLVVPLMVDQLGYGHTEAGIDELARLNVENFAEVLGAPFDTRYGYFDLTVSAAVGAVLVAIAAIAVLVRPPREWPLVRSLILPLSFVPVAAVLVVTAVSTDVLLTRYAAVAAPFMLVLVAAAADTRRSRAALAAVGVAALAAASGSLLAHTPSARYQDWRGGAEEIAKAPGRGDAIVLTHSAIGPTFEYYAAGTNLEALPRVGFNEPGVKTLLEQGRPLWIFLYRPADRQPASRSCGSRLPPGEREDLRGK